MALAKFTKGEQSKTARMFAPKKITEISAWYKAARKVIPFMPDLDKTDWFMTHHEATIHLIEIRIANSVGEEAVLLIDRRIPALGGL